MKKITLTIVSNLVNDMKGCKVAIMTAKKYGKFEKVNLITTSTKKKINEIKDLCERLGLELNTILIRSKEKLIDENETESYSGLSHISADVFNKFFIFNKIQEKTLYIDTDMIFTKRFKMSSLIKKKEGIYFVKNGFINPNYWLKWYESIYSCVEEVSEKAFNSGMIFINTDDFLEREAVFNKLVMSLRENKFNYLDQSHFNFVFKDNCEFLPINYNWPYHTRKNKYVLKRKPFIIHFASSNKPWNQENIKDKYVKFWKKEYEILQKLMSK